MKKILSLLLVVLIVGSMVACSKGDSNETLVSENSTVSTEQVEIDPKYVYNKPDKNYAINGEKKAVTMLVRTQSKQFHDPNSPSGSTVVDSAVFTRNTVVEDAFGVKFEFHDMNGYRAGQADFKTAIINANSSGDECYDIVSPAMFGNDLILEGVWADLSKSDYIDSEKGWWSTTYSNATRLNDKQYTLTGDLSVDMLRCMTCVYFNKNMYDNVFANDEKYKDLYAIVDAGEWTIETMFQLARKASSDVNNDGKYTFDSDDIFGFVSQHAFLRAFPTMSGISYIENDNGDIYTNFYSTKTIDLFNLVQSSLITSNEGLAFGTNETEMIDNFKQNQTLFYGASLEGTLDSVRDMSEDYGILINPKYYLEDEYVTGSGGATIFAIPTNAPDFEMSAILLEALGYYSYVHIRPAFFDGVMKGQASRDEQSYHMLDKIRETLYIDFVHAFGNDFDIYETAFYGTVRNESMTLTSFWNKYGSRYERQFENFETLLGNLE